MSQFIDEVIVTVRSGPGARGCESYFKRADHKKIPNGGDGGDGGDVILQVDSNTGSLFPLKSKRIFEAERGELGTRNNGYGRKGKDCIVKVPCGTTVYNQNDNLLIRDLLTPGDQVTVVKGGRGGYGNHSGRPATSAGPAQELELLLSFKIIADIFLVGLPNSGKTSLLKKLTGAHVTEAEYPFATKAPQLGTYRSNFSQLRVCELPAIYGASEEGRGLGTHFLKHLERARLIFLMLDSKSDFADDLKTGYDILVNTIEHFKTTFLEIPRFVVVNKIDLLVGKKRPAAELSKISDKVFPISTKDGDGIDRLMKSAEELLGAFYASTNQ